MTRDEKMITHDKLERIWYEVVPIIHMESLRKTTVTIMNAPTMI
jgi:hypothetical protein